MNNHLEKQIADMLEKVMIDDFDDTQTLDSSKIEPTDCKGLKAKTYQNEVARNSDLYKVMQQRAIPQRKPNTTHQPHNKSIFEEKMPFSIHQNESNIYNGNIDVNWYNQPGMDSGNHVNLNLNDCVFHGNEKMLNASDKIDDKLYNYLKGNFIAIIRTQNGSRIFQKYLKNTSQVIITKIFEEVLPFIKDLLLDLYANYFCQKLYGVIQFTEKILWLKAVNNFNSDRI
jgi:hypothetical protein